MATRFSVIDLGTNTFHILIIESTSGHPGWRILHKQRIFVNLAEEGIQQIGPASWERGHTTLEAFIRLSGEFNVGHIKAVGTAALRIAANAPEFVTSVRESLGLEVEIISGMREAELIARGVSLALPDLNTPFLILDIGGGSLEFIILEGNSIAFSRSFPLGIAILHDMFHQTEPIARAELDALNNFLRDNFEELYTLIPDFEGITLVGAAGSFEVIEMLTGLQNRTDSFGQYETSIFWPVYEKIIRSDYEARLSLEDIPSSRARYLVVAMALIHHVLKMLPSKTFLISDYALKEGIVAEYLKSLD
jgi:exopolyphosphatase/guanosine-5'-triphosphate,3'-diphosphate pyrophosphatase